MNPLLRQPNDDRPLAFDEIDADAVSPAVAEVLDQVQSLRAAMVASDEEDKRMRLHGFDRLHELMAGLMSPLYLLAETHEDQDVRQACRQGVQKMLERAHELRSDSGLYRCLLRFSEMPMTLLPVEMRLLSKTLDDYRRNGMELSDEERAQLLQLNHRLTELELKFGQHISEDQPVLELTASECDGLSDAFCLPFRQPDGSVRVPGHAANYTMIMKFAKQADVRERMFRLFMNRAREQNRPVLREMLALRQQKATLLGFPTFADYQLADKMAGSPQQVTDFMQELRLSVQDKAAQDYAELLRHQDGVRLAAWDRAYVAERIREAKYALHDEELKAYFPLDQVLRGLFQLAFDLFGVSFREADHLPTWHESVRGYELVDGDRVMGRCYLDLFPRASKYSHAACFDIREGRDTGVEFQIPESALVCNFSEATDQHPALLTHAEVETLFHEFGHLLHQLLTRSPLASLAGTNVIHDFVEVPSQLFEHWAWDAGSLKAFARHWQTGEVIPDALIERLQSTRHFGSGLHVEQQLFYGAIDMAFHTDFAPEKNDPSQITQQLQEAYTRFPYVPDTGFETCFGHLTGYAAGYYGYLWSRVFADDLFSEFEKGGVRSRQVGMRLREGILAKGDCEDPGTLIHRFLGRPPNQDAFRRHLGLAATP